MRSESFAYEKSNHSSKNMMNRIMLYVRYNKKALLAASAFLVFVLILSSDTFHPSGPDSIRASYRHQKAGHFGGAVHQGYFDPKKSNFLPNQFKFAAVTDLDQLSRIPDTTKFKSTLLSGFLTYDPSSGTYSVEIGESRTLISGHNEAGRGMELSELTLYNGRLLAFDDRTGTVFEILSKDAGTESYVVPRFVITEGNGDTDKGMKWEWASVKDGELYMGSMGKEYTKPDGSIANTNNLWIAIMKPNGEIRREDWSSKYNFVRARLGASPPGYLINEAILWSSHLKKWCFLPRRISSEAYDENEDERKGSNKLVLVDEHFTSAKIVDIQMKVVDPLHGFSSFAFVPGTKDTHALAIRSVEEDCVGGEEDVCKQRSYMIVFNVLTGEVLMDEYEFANVKYEGVEFVDITSQENVE
mmetsp:Transcript_2855/g.4039  ORF Transcript_2855/g.4039 Transcript_2855/m.4039 type:complete len:414 (+) Transcript_2855:538-1779(+)